MAVDFDLRAVAGLDRACDRAALAEVRRAADWKCIDVYYAIDASYSLVYKAVRLLVAQIGRDGSCGG